MYKPSQYHRWYCIENDDDICVWEKWGKDQTFIEFFMKKNKLCESCTS